MGVVYRKIFSSVFLVSFSIGAWAQVSTQGLDISVSYPNDAYCVEWMRDIYREIDLREWDNSALFSPMEEDLRQQGLFMRLLTLATDGRIPVYRYAIDGTEQLTSQGKIDIREVLEAHYIPFIERNGRLIVRRDDVPMNEVMKYYIRENVFYDGINGSFRRRVTAICPVLIQDDEFGEEKLQYPLFWARYADAEPYLRDLPIIPDYRNVSQVIPMADYFTLNLYRGRIYKISNAFGQTLAQTSVTDSAFEVLRSRIERELIDVKTNTYSVFSKPEPQVENPRDVNGGIFGAIKGLFTRKRKIRDEKANVSADDPATAYAADKRTATPLQSGVKAGTDETEEIDGVHQLKKISDETGNNHNVQ